MEVSGLGQRLTTNDQRRLQLLLGAVLLIIPLLLYRPALQHDFLSLWDDDAYVTDNPHVRTGLTLANMRWAFTSFEQSNWHPVTWLSHMLDCQLFGLNPGAQHGVNMLLHAANVLLLFWILQKATGPVGRSFFVALLFAVHPLNVETVAWIAQRKSLLSAFFSLLTVAAYGWYVRCGGWTRYLLLVFLFALSLMAKPMAVSLPLLLLLFDYWPLRRYEELAAARRWVRLTLEKLPLFAMSAASSVLTEMAQRAGGSVMGVSLLPVSTRIENAAISYVAYIGKIVWPAKLAAYYPLRFSPPVGDAIASAAILIVISALALYLRRSRYIAVGWFFFVIAMIPVIGIVQVGFQGIADRYTYVPAIGLMIAVVWGVADAVQMVPVARASLSVVGLCIAMALSVTTARYLPAWQNPVTLFAHARAAWGQPDMWLEQLYGNALFSAGRIDEALGHYQASCAIQPRTEYCHYNIAHIFSGRGQFRDAIREYDLALRYTANREMAVLCLTEEAEAQLQVGDYLAAESSVAKALNIDPSNSAALQLRAQIIHRTGGVY
ncbi:MAG TPA: tetratricopeptide repeat protein [Candidatus Sulfotelmatobacter sp.]|nr:tetratricopeptide repeat protein [Candidatus Sulfotelmatobacter sp.]